MTSPTARPCSCAAPVPPALVERMRVELGMSNIVNGYGNALWFGIFGGVLLLAGWAMWTGRRWGRGIGIYAQMLLLPVSWYAGVGSGQWGYAIPVALVSVAVLVLLFSPATIQWLTGGADSAKADRSGPDKR